MYSARSVPSSLEANTATSVLRGAARSVATWAVLIAVAIDLLAAVCEPAFVVLRGGPFRAGLATAVAAMGLSVVVAIGAAVPLAAVHALVGALARLPRPWRHAWPLPIVLAAWVLVITTVPHVFLHALSVQAGQWILVAVLTAGALVATGVARVRDWRVRTSLSALLTLATLVLNAKLPYTFTNEPRDILWTCTVLLFAAGFHPLRVRAARWPYERVSRGMAALFVVSVPLVALAPLLCHDWRTFAQNGARFAPRLARFCRMAIDFDADGFSPVVWGTDCNDADPAINPAMRERRDGVDHNCNGKRLGATSTDAERGLALPVGSPDAAPGEIDRVVLVTIDCLRADAFTPEVTPSMVRLAGRGVRFTRMYSQGGRTAMSLPYVLRGDVEAPSVAQILGGEGVTTTAVFGYRHSTLESNVFDGFQRVVRPDLIDHRIRAPALTDAALEDLRDPAHARAHFLWVHYFDAHGPRARRVLPADVPVFAPIRGERDAEDSALYLSELNLVDRHVGRLVDGISQMDHPERTLVIVTNDHGEGFGRHGVYAHGVSAFEAIVHAPGLMLAPGTVAGAYEHVVAQRDIAATVLGAFGLVGKHPEIERFGRSWLRVRGAPDGRGVRALRADPLHEFVVSYVTTRPFDRWADAPMASVVDDHGKLSVSYVDGIVRLYDLDADPAEDNDLASSRTADVARYREELETFRDIDAPPPSP
jgi:hypothetical protein